MRISRRKRRPTGVWCCDEPTLKKLAEDLRYSDPVSSDTLAEIEWDLSAAVDELQAAAIDGDSAEAADGNCVRPGLKSRRCAAVDSV